MYVSVTASAGARLKYLITLLYDRNILRESYLHVHQ
jgi:hypothetical protein